LWVEASLDCARVRLPMMNPDNGLKRLVLDQEK